jgi:sec-independent protein translocase protein TatA
MGGLNIWHLVFAGVVLLLLFGGRGKISGIMGDTAKGIRAFRDGLKGEDEQAAEEPPEPAKPLPKPAVKPAAAKAKTTAAKPRAKAKAKA